MLRELNDLEMGMVSGGEDEIIVTGTKYKDPWVTSISAADARALFGDTGIIIDAHGGMGVQGQMGGGSFESESNEDSTAEEECDFGGFPTRQALNRHLDSMEHGPTSAQDRTAQNGAAAGAAMLDAILGCGEHG